MLLEGEVDSALGGICSSAVVMMLTLCLTSFQTSTAPCRPDISESPELRQKSPLFQFAEVMFASYT